MKIGIITHYDVHNHGAILQLNGLASFLRELGHEAFALQFDKNYDFLGIGLKSKYDISFKSIPIYLKYAKEKGLRRTLFNIKKRSLLNAFKSDNSLIGPYYTEAGELDAVIVGSDEVFALHTGPTPVFYGHAAPSKHVISYAGSFGPTTIKDIDSLHCREFVASGLSRMSSLSVRDINSRDIVKELIGYEPEVVVDPVILYGYKKEIESFARPISERYMVIYAYDEHMNDPEEISAIKQLANKMHLKIVSPGFYHSWADINVNVSPIGLLQYVRYADLVVTDTFHGSVTSIICNTPFASKVRGNGNKLCNLLSEYNLENRIVSSPDELEKVVNTAIDYEEVNSIIEQRREKSSQFLKSAL